MIQLKKMSMMRGVKTLLSDANVDIFPGHKIGIIGSNGCGKSSLFAMVRNEIQPDAGDCLVPKHWRIVSVAQETPAVARAALEYVIDGDRQLRALQQQLMAAEERNQGDDIARIHDELAQAGAFDVEARASSILAGLGFSNDQLTLPVSDFSGGWRMRLNLAQALLCESDLLLLDEPTNHLDLDAVIWLEGWIQRYKGTLLLISHDKSFIDACVSGILSFEQQHVFLYSGNYSSYERQRAERLRLQASEYEKQEKHKAHLTSFITRFKAKASKAKQAQSRIKQLEKMEELLPVHQASEFSFSFKPPSKLPNPLVMMEKVHIGYPGKVILAEVKLNLVPGSRIGLLGKNGAGKSTLIKLLSKQLAPLSGDYQVSAGLEIGYFAQHQVEFLDLNASAHEHLFRLDKTLTDQQIRDYLGGFGFKGDAALSPVSPMSGGEKARLVLALVVFLKPNLLLLDEPTNHLDIEMRHALSFALQAFEGAMILVSHDRALLTEVCDEFYLVDAGTVAQFNGDLDDYKKWLLTADKPEQITKPKLNIDRKQQKRLDAEFRQITKPLRNTISSQEKILSNCEQALKKIELLLADTQLYDEQNKARLKETLAKQAEWNKQQEEAEIIWLEAQEALDAVMSDAERTVE